MKSKTSLTEEILDWLEPLRIWPYRLTFRFPSDAEYEIPRLRGVWGRALHLLDEELYRKVFEGTGPVNLKTPQYIIRPSDEGASASRSVQKGIRRESVDFITWGTVSANKKLSGEYVTRTDWLLRLIRAWDIASGMGIGKNRYPFVLERVEKIAPFSDSGGISIVKMIQKRSFSPTLPCRVEFSVPVRIMNGRQLCYEPDLAMIVQATLIRCALLRLQSTGEINSYKASSSPTAILPDFSERLSAEVERIAAGPWIGEPIVTRRYSGRQKNEIDLYGAVGGLELQQGCGALALILAAAEIIHIGKSTTLGLGRLRLQFSL